MLHQLKVHGALLTVALIYGANYTIAKAVMPAYLPPSGLILIRVACALWYSCWFRWWCGPSR